MSNLRADTREIKSRKASQLETLSASRLHQAMMHLIKLEEVMRDAGRALANDI
jgi:hypothetical protein